MVRQSEFNSHNIISLDGFLEWITSIFITKNIFPNFFLQISNLAKLPLLVLLWKTFLLHQIKIRKETSKNPRTIFQGQLSRQQTVTANNTQQENGVQAIAVNQAGLIFMKINNCLYLWFLHIFHLILSLIVYLFECSIFFCVFILFHFLLACLFLCFCIFEC